MSEPEGIKINLHQPILSYHPSHNRFIKRTDEQTGKDLELFHMIHRSINKPQLKLTKRPNPDIKGESIEILDADLSVDAITIEERSMLAQEVFFNYHSKKEMEFTADQVDEIKELMTKRYCLDMEAIGQVINAFKGKNYQYAQYLNEQRLKPITELEFDGKRFLKELKAAARDANIPEEALWINYISAFFHSNPEHMIMINFAIPEEMPEEIAEIPEIPEETPNPETEENQGLNEEVTLTETKE